MSATGIAPSKADYATLAHRGYEAFNNDALDELDPEFLADDVTITNIASGMTAQGREGFIALLRHLKSPFPDARVEIVAQFVTDDAIVSEGTFRGTHSAPMRLPNGMEVPPTGRKVEGRFCEVWRIRDGKLVSLHNYSDNLTLMQQLGLMG